MKHFALKYFLFLFFFLSLFVSGVMDSQDGFQYLAVARHIYYKGEPTAPVYGHNDGTNIHMSTGVAPNGKTYSPTGLGYSLALVPAVALTDVVYQHFDITPVENFPLENDWLILLTASFTNTVFAAGLGVVLYKYLKELKLKHKQALLISFLALVSTNLFVLSKHSAAHMMFVAFLVTSFYLLKVFSRTKKLKHILFSGLSYGVVVISYNSTFALPLLSYILYYVLLTRPKLSRAGLKKTVTSAIVFLLAVLPFFMIHAAYERLKIPTGASVVSPVFLTNYAKNYLFSFPISIFIEGLWGQLFSPGRSFFLFSPLLVLPILFWHKIKKGFVPELAVFILLSVTYIFFYATQYYYLADTGYTPAWHGESSWGPRYLSPLIPFGMLIVGSLYKNFSQKAKYFVFFPLLLVGLYVEMLGALMPYQIKFHELEREFTLNGTQYTSFTYTNLLPRYSSVFMMSKKLVKLVQSFPKTLDHGIYNVRFYDGIDFTFNVGPQRWRSVEGMGHLSFDDSPSFPINNISFEFINHALTPEASSSAEINVLLNNKELRGGKTVIRAGKSETIQYTDIKDKVVETNNLQIDVRFSRDDVTKQKSQLVAIKAMSINSVPVNLESIDVPYISDLGPAIMNVEYKNWGGINKDPWKTWHIHTQIFERTPDFWWIRPLYYWDIPNKPFIFAFIANTILVIYFGKKINR